MTKPKTIWRPSSSSRWRRRGRRRAGIGTSWCLPPLPERSQSTSSPRVASVEGQVGHGRSGLHRLRVGEPAVELGVRSCASPTPSSAGPTLPAFPPTAWHATQTCAEDGRAAARPSTGRHRRRRRLQGRARAESRWCRSGRSSRGTRSRPGSGRRVKSYCTMRRWPGYMASGSFRKTASHGCPRRSTTLRELGRVVGALPEDRVAAHAVVGLPELLPACDRFGQFIRVGLSWNAFGTCRR